MASNENTPPAGEACGDLYALRIQSPRFGYAFAFRKPARVWLEPMGAFLDFGIRLETRGGNAFDLYLPSPWQGNQKPRGDVLLDGLADALFIKCDELLTAEAEGVMTKDADELLEWIRGAFEMLDSPMAYNDSQAGWAQVTQSRRNREAGRPSRHKPNGPVLWKPEDEPIGPA